MKLQRVDNIKTMLKYNFDIGIDEDYVELE